MPGHTSSHGGGGFNRDPNRGGNRPTMADIAGPVTSTPSTTTSTTSSSTNTQTGGGSDSSQSQNLLSYSYSNLLGGQNINDTPENREILNANATISAGGGALTDGSGNLVAAGGALKNYRDNKRLEEAKAEALALGYSPTTIDPLTSLGSLEDVFAAQRQRLQNVGLASIDPFGLTGQYNYANQLFQFQPNLSLQNLRSYLDTGAVYAPVDFDFNPNVFGTEEEEDDPGFFRTLGENLMTDASNIYGAITDPFGTAIKAADVLTKTPLASPLGYTARVAGNVLNFRPQFEDVDNPDSPTTKTSFFGDLGTATFGEFNPENYDLGDVTKQEFYNALYDPDPDSVKGYSVNRNFADELGISLTSEYKEQQAAKEAAMEESKKDTRGPADVYIPPSTSTTSGAAASGTGTGTATVDTTDYQGIYNNFSADQKATADKIMAMDEYDLPYAVDYVRMGGPLF